MGLTKIQKELMEMRRNTTREKMAALLESKGLSPIVETEEQFVRREIAATFGTDCNPGCPECGGSGYVRVNPDAEVTDIDFGKVRTCSRFRAVLVQEVDPKEFGMEKDELSLGWSAIQSSIGGVALEGPKAVAAVKPAYEKGYGMIALLGSFGQGKTLVGKILIARALSCGKRAAYANMNRILNDIRAAFDEKESMTRELVRKMEYWNSLDCLFIDELDKVNGTGWAQTIMFEVLDRRYVRAVREEALTVIASNKKDDELDGYLVDRLHDKRISKIVYLNGESARPLMPAGYKY
jgi:hypothetical protein